MAPQALLKTEYLKLVVPNPEKPTNFVIYLQSLPENRITLGWMDSYNKSLDIVEKTMKDLPKDKENVGGSLITASTGKFFCNGFKIEELFKHRDQFLVKIMVLYARLLAFPLPTVSAINGHGFGGGCMLALCHDFCVMNNEKGFLSMNEITIGLPIQHSYVRIIKTKISDPLILKKCLLNGHRFTGVESVSLGLVDKAVPQADVFTAATQITESQSKFAVNRGVPLGQIKSELYREAITSLRSGETLAGGYLAKL